MIESNDYPTLIREALSAYGPIPEVLLTRAVIKQVEPIRRNRQVIITRIQRVMRSMTESGDLIQDGNLFGLRDKPRGRASGADEVIEAFAYIRDHGPICGADVRKALEISAYAVSHLEDIGLIRHAGDVGRMGGRSKVWVVA